MKNLLTILLAFLLPLGATYADEFMESELFDIDGSFSYKEREMLREARRKNRRLKRENRIKRLEDRQRDALEDLKARNEMKLNNKVSKIRFDSERNLLDELFDNGERTRETVTATKPVTTTTTVQKEKKDAKRSFKINRLTLGMGRSHFKGHKLAPVSSNPSLQIGISGPVTDYFNVGFYVGMTKMNIKETRDINYQRFNFDILGTAYLLRISFLRFYAKGGLGYNLVGLSYSKETPEEKFLRSKGVSHSIVNGTIGLGVELSFSKNVALYLDSNYRFNLTSSFSSAKSYRHIENEEERTIKTLAQRLKKSHESAINAGFKVTF